MLLKLPQGRCVPGERQTGKIDPVFRQRNVVRVVELKFRQRADFEGDDAGHEERSE